MNSPAPELPAATALHNPFADPLGTLERHWRAMLVVFCVGALASLALWWLHPPAYFAAATVVVSGPADSTGVLSRSGEAETLPVTEVIVAQALSRSNLAELIAKFGLYAELQGVVTTAEIVELTRAQVTIRELKRLESRQYEGAERVYSIGFEAPTQEAAVAVANQLAGTLVEVGGARQRRQQEAAISLLRSELGRAQAQLDERNEAIATFRRQKRGMLPGDLRANQTRQRELGALRDKLVQLRSQNTSRHPAVQDLERQIAAHQREIAALDARTASMRAVEDELVALEAAAKLSREDYLGLKRELQRAELARSLLDAQPGGALSVLNPAELPARDVSARWRFLVLGLAASFGLALACALALDLLSPVVTSPDDIVEITGQPVLGWVTRIR